MNHTNFIKSTGISEGSWEDLKESILGLLGSQLKEVGTGVM